MDNPHSLNLGDVCREHRRTNADKIAVVCGEDRFTYRELDDRVNRLANSLLDIGVREGDRVQWLAQNCHRTLESLLACAKIGAVLSPSNWRGAPHELAFVIDDLGPKVVVWQEEDIGGNVRQARGLANAKATWLQQDGTGEESYETFLSASNEEPGLCADPWLPVLILYTSAFSGRPNGSMLTHVGLLTQSVWFMYLQDIDPMTVCLNAGPLFHIAPWVTAIPTFHVGGTNVFVRRADPNDICRAIHRERCTRGWILPQTAERIVELNHDRTYDLSSFQSSISMPGWNEMTAPDTSRHGRTVGGYGQTELTGGALSGFLGGRPGDPTCGKPSPIVQVRVVNENGEEVSVGKPGELLIRGPQVHAGFWNRPELNEKRFRGGWWHTNDLVRREPDGVISFVAPKGRLIKSGAENIYPAEVETCLESHPAVKEVAIIGVPDDRWVQSVKAIVVLEVDATASADELIDHCRRNLASYKKPRAVEFVDTLPRIADSKDYESLDRQFGGGGYPGSGTGVLRPTQVGP